MIEPNSKPTESCIKTLLGGSAIRHSGCSTKWTGGATVRAQLRLADVYVLIDGRSSEQEFGRLVQALVGVGVSVLQLRDKRLNDRQLLQRARLLRQLTRDTETLFVMNDRADLAQLSAADGVHVGQDELGVADVREIVGADRIVGVSTHNLAQVRQAIKDGADYLGCGPTFPSRTKRFEHFPGLDFLRQVAAEVGIPAFAIGGIEPGNLDTLIATGFRRVAVSSAVVNTDAPAEIVQQLRRRLAGKPRHN